ncbi:MAG TPA: hypothetical protein P5235_09735 [Saprospiraceae bacterium]|nr:hypothetical protein [Saprospiraceae bacterium]
MNSIKLKDWQKNVLLMAAFIGIMGLLYLSVQRKANAPLQRVLFYIKPLDGNQYLINENDIKLKFRNYLGYELVNLNIKELNLQELEILLNEDERVKKAELFVDSNDRLQIWVVQRQPIVRVMSKSGQYYLDEEGGAIKVNSGPSIRVPLATGNVVVYDEKMIKSESDNALKDLYVLSKAIHQDAFLESLIEQIDVGREDKMMLIPKIGRQKLSIGSIDNLEDKLENLKIIYKEGLPIVEWSQYSVLTLDYEGLLYVEKL